MLTGCGFRTAVYCATCYCDDASPCCNCQAARLRAERTDGTPWEQPVAEAAPAPAGAEPSLAFAPLQRLAAACVATPGGICGWDPEWMTTPDGSRLPRDEADGREWQLKSTLHGAAFPPACCANGSSALGGDAGGHCAFVLGRPVATETAKEDGAWSQPVHVDWRVRPRVHRVSAMAYVPGAALPRPDAWPALVYVVQFYANDDGSGALAEVTGLSSPGVLARIPLAAPPASCRIGPYSALTISDGRAERVFPNTDVVGLVVPLGEVGWTDRALFYAVHSLESAPPSAAPTPPAPSPWPTAAAVGADEDVLHFGPPHRPGEARRKWTGCYADGGSRACGLAGAVPWGMHRRDLCAWAECTLDGGDSMNDASNGVDGWEYCSDGGISLAPAALPAAHRPRLCAAGGDGGVATRDDRPAVRRPKRPSGRAGGTGARLGPRAPGCDGVHAKGVRRPCRAG